jgi:hypothetical protein
LVFATRKGAKTGTYVVALDDALVEQIDRARRLQLGRGRRERLSGVGGARLESALTPREMQARLRAGRTIDEVAAEAGVGVEWVERFAAPILAEQALAVARAGELTLTSPSRGPSDRPLRASVLRNLADRGVYLLDDEMDAAWSAYRLAGAEWAVHFELDDGGRALAAEWSLDLASSSLTARNTLAVDLGFVDSDRQAATPDPATPDPATPDAANQDAANQDAATPAAATEDATAPDAATQDAAGDAADGRGRARPRPRRASIATGDGPNRRG